MDIRFISLVWKIHSYILIWTCGPLSYMYIHSSNVFEGMNWVAVDRSSCHMRIRNVLCVYHYVFYFLFHFKPNFIRRYWLVKTVNVFLSFACICFYVQRRDSSGMTSLKNNTSTIVSYGCDETNPPLTKKPPGSWPPSFHHSMSKGSKSPEGFDVKCTIFTFQHSTMYWLQVNGTEPCYDKSTLVQVMAWCRQATSHYLSQCWPRSMSPYEATRPQRVNACNPVDLLHNLWEHNWDINSLVPGRFWWNFRLVIFKFILVIDGWGISSILVKLPSWECQWTLLMISQHWFGQWLGAVRQQAITWANFDPDPWRH